MKRLTEELSELSRQQWEALRTWTFLGVAEEEHQAFAERRKRIGELAQIISGFKPINFFLSSLRKVHPSIFHKGTLALCAGEFLTHALTLSAINRLNIFVPARHFCGAGP